MYRLLLMLGILGSLSVIQGVGTAHAQTLTCTLDREAYLPGEPIVVALVYCPKADEAGREWAPRLSPQAGHASLALTETTSGRQVRMTAPIVDRAGRVPPESLPPGECAIECLDLIQWFGTGDWKTPPIVECLGVTAIPLGRYKLRVVVEAPGRVGSSLTAEQTFQIRNDPLPPAERVLVDKFVEGSPGPTATGTARGEYCRRMFPEFANSRYASYVYYRTGSLMGEIPLEEALEASGGGPGSDARHARLLLHRFKLLPSTAPERANLVAKYGAMADSPLTRLAVRQIYRRGAP